MKNIVFILVDAFGSNFIGNTEYRNSPTPFLDKLKEKGLFCNNVYSLAPYTEAALIATLGGEMTFDNGGYLKALKNCEYVLSEVLKEKGYKTLSTLSPYIYNASFLRGVDEYVYCCPADLVQTTEYRLKEMRSFYKEGKFCEQDFIECADILEMGLIDWKNCLTSIVGGDGASELIKKKAKNIDYINSIKEITEEIETIKKNPSEYIKKLFDLWENHSLFKIQTTDIKIKIFDKTRLYVIKNYSALINKIAYKQKQLFRKNNKFEGKTFYSIYKNEGFFNSLRYIKRFYEQIITKDTANVLDEYDSNQHIFSIKKIFDLFIPKILKMDSEDQNYYAYIHVDDFHIPNAFFSYDEDNIDQIDKEFKAIEKYFETLPSNYRGNIITDLSAIYIDTKIEEFVTALSKKLTKETIFVLTADHGYSYYHYPLRINNVNNFYKENFQTPLFIWGDGITPIVEASLFSTMDIPSTLLHYANISNDNYFCGKVIGRDQGRAHVFSEWGGSGIPDLKRKELWQSVYDGRIKVALKTKYNEKITPKKISHIFDLSKDPFEKNNLSKKVRKSNKIKPYLQLLEKRKEDIKNSNHF